MQRLKQLMTIAVLSLSMVGVSATSASAAPSRATLAAVVKAVEYENVGGANYGYYKARYPSQINWTNDGCSVPKYVWVSPALGLVLRHYSGVFEHSCDRHDFGYRNYGKGSSPGVHLKLDPTEARRDSIDSRFYSNMKLQCSSRYSHWYEVAAKGACNSAATVYYEAVARGGKTAFFG